MQAMTQAPDSRYHSPGSSHSTRSGTYRQSEENYSGSCRYLLWAMLISLRNSVSCYIRYNGHFDTFCLLISNILVLKIKQDMSFKYCITTETQWDSGGNIPYYRTFKNIIHL